VRRGASVAALTLALAAGGCGGTSPSGQRTLDEFFRGTALGRKWARRFPHKPGSVSCTVSGSSTHGRVPATCSTAFSLGARHRVIVTFTESWSHGSRARTWFVFLRPDGTVASVRREGTPG